MPDLFNLTAATSPLASMLSGDSVAGNGAQISADPASNGGFSALLAQQTAPQVAAPTISAQLPDQATGDLAAVAVTPTDGKAAEAAMATGKILPLPLAAVAASADLMPQDGLTEEATATDNTPTLPQVTTQPILAALTKAMNATRSKAADTDQSTAADDSVTEEPMSEEVPAEAALPDNGLTLAAAFAQPVTTPAATHAPETKQADTVSQLAPRMQDSSQPAPKQATAAAPLAQAVAQMAAQIDNPVEVAPTVTATATAAPSETITLAAQDVAQIATIQTAAQSADKDPMSGEPIASEQTSQLNTPIAAALAPHIAAAAPKPASDVEAAAEIDTDTDTIATPRQSSVEQAAAPVAKPVTARTTTEQGTDTTGQQSSDAPSDNSGKLAAKVEAAPLPMLDQSVAQQANIASATTADALRDTLTTSAAASNQSAPATDMAALVDRLVEARQAARSGSASVVETSIQHAEFGRVSLSFKQDKDGMSVSMSSADPAFAPAAQAAMAQAQAQVQASAASADTGSSSQQGQSGSANTYDSGLSKQMASNGQTGGQTGGNGQNGSQTFAGQNAQGIAAQPVRATAAGNAPKAEDTTSILSRRAGILA